MHKARLSIIKADLTANKKYEELVRLVQTENEGDVHTQTASLREVQRGHFQVPTHRCWTDTQERPQERMLSPDVCGQTTALNSHPLMIVVRRVVVGRMEGWSTFLFLFQSETSICIPKMKYNRSSRSRATDCSDSVLPIIMSLNSHTCLIEGAVSRRRLVSCIGLRPTTCRSND